jgi:hypothetical protein
VVPRASWGFAPTVTEAQKQQAISDNEDALSGVRSDALLFLGPAASLTEAPIHPDIYLDREYRAEISRRKQIMTGQPLTGSDVEENPMAPHYMRP